MGKHYTYLPICGQHTPFIYGQHPERPSSFIGQHLPSWHISVGLVQTEYKDGNGLSMTDFREAAVNSLMISYSNVSFGSSSLSVWFVNWDRALTAINESVHIAMDIILVFGR